jgi:hypothetical protein
MKLHKIALGVAALTAIAGPAFALTASTYNAANAMEIYVSGATAMDVGLENATLAMCQAGTIHKYTVSNQAVWLCTPRTTGANAIGNLAGRTQLAVHKHSVGGSGNGVAPVNNSTPLPFLDLVKIASSCAAATGAATVIACTEASTTLTTTQVAPLGISDVEPQFFGAATGTYNNLIIEPLATVIFGLPVTTTAYTALQAAQGLSIGATDAANIPSLSSAQITSLFTQEGQSWAAVTGATLADDTVYVARRADSSGTQKTYEAVIVRSLNTTAAGKSCNAGLPAFLSGTDVLDNNAANTLCDGTSLILNNSGSGQVAACLNRFNAVGKGAIGTLTTEAVSAAGWKHVRVNGLLGNYANVKSGAYTAYGDAALNTRRTPAIDGDHAAYKAAFKALFAAVPVLHPAFGDTLTDAGKGGVIGLNKVTGATTGNPWNRTDDAGVIDNCRPARADF